MRRFFIPAFLSLLALPVMAEPDSGLVVHEWGTFTSFAGSDGVYLDYRTRVAGDLPDFVRDRAREANASIPKPFAPSEPDLSLKERIMSLSRMETPVTYFYTDVPMKVHARVDFPKGILTEFYPPVAKMAPLVTPEEKTGKIMPAVRNGMLDWGELVLTPAHLATDTSKIPAVSQGDRYAAARETDSDIVQSTDSAGAVHQEKFLFYRGICNIDLPLRLKSLGHDRFELTDPAKTPITAAFLVQIDRGNVRYTQITDMKPRLELTLPEEIQSLDTLAEELTRDLVTAGLYEKEAKAMVATWKSSWFGEDGTRVLYLLPQAMTDSVLPLKITPSPRKTARVMVGRLEAMTPEREQQISLELSSAGEVSSLGRFAEPILKRISTVATDPGVKSRAKAMLAAMH